MMDNQYHGITSDDDDDWVAGFSFNIKMLSYLFKNAHDNDKIGPYFFYLDFHLYSPSTYPYVHTIRLLCL